MKTEWKMEKGGFGERRFKIQDKASRRSEKKNRFRTSMLFQVLKIFNSKIRLKDRESNCHSFPMN